MASGSDKRQRSRRSSTRWTEDEFARANERAGQAGFALAAFMRAATLGDAGPRAQRRPPADQQVLRELLGQLGRVGNNINQLARAVNSGKVPSIAELQKAVDACRRACTEIYKALGKKPGADP